MGFSQVVANGMAGFGFVPEAPTIYEFPTKMFLADSDLTPIRENIDKIIYGLTKWEPKVKEKGIYYHSENIVVQGKDYRKAEDNMNYMFLKRMWGDGLPIIPPTPERVEWILTGTDLPANSLIGTGKVLPLGRIITVREAAICLAMAGGRPEYLPVVIAAMDAILDPLMMHQSWQATTQGAFPALIVNGPIAKQIRLHSGYGIMGPDPLYPAGGPIGRAIRLILIDLGGAIPGIGTTAIYGAMRFTNAIFAEDEAGLPKGWEALSVERGFPKEINVVSMTSVASAVNVNVTSADSKDPAGMWREYLHRMAQVMAGRQTPIRQCPGLIILSRGWAQGIADLGYSKLDVKDFLWENSKIPWPLLEATGRVSSVRAYGIKEGEGTPVMLTPQELLLVVAGGAQSGHGYWMMPGMGSTDIVSREIKLPAKAKWDALLKEAEKNLGPIPAQ